MNAHMEEVLQKIDKPGVCYSLVVSCDAWENLKLATELCNTAPVLWLWGFVQKH